MSTNKEAFKRANVSNINYCTVFEKRKLNSIEIEKLARFLKPAYIISKDDYIIFKYPRQTQLLKIMK